MGQQGECLNNVGLKETLINGSNSRANKGGYGCGRLGERRCNGKPPTYGNGLIGPAYNPSKNDEGNKGSSIQTTAEITLGLALGGPDTQNMPEIYGENPDEQSAPYIPGVSPGIHGPMPVMLCQPGPAAALCLASFFVSLVPAANNPANPNTNFFLSFDVAHQEGAGTIISNIRYSNTYAGQAVFSYLAVNDTIVHEDASRYMSHTGQYESIGGVYISNNGISVDGRVITVTNGPNGAIYAGHPLQYYVPPLP